MSYVKRRIDVVFRLGTGSFGEGGADTVRITGRRASAYISVAGGATLGELHLRIYGVSLQIMNQLNTIGIRRTDQRNNEVDLLVGDDSAMATIFQGNIVDAYIDFQAMPEVSFVVVATVGGLYRMKPAVPISYAGTVDAATILADLAGRMNMNFENGGVTVQLRNVYYKGSFMEQIETCCIEANIDHVIDNNTLAVWPRNGSRGGAALLVSAATGMVGYPNFNSMGISLTILFRPGMQFGSLIQVSSDLTAANGQWVIYKFEYELEADIPGGAWFIRLEAARPGLVPVSR